MPRVKGRRTGVTPTTEPDHDPTPVAASAEPEPATDPPASRPPAAVEPGEPASPVEQAASLTASEPPEAEPAEAVAVVEPTTAEPSTAEPPEAGPADAVAVVEPAAAEPSTAELASEPPAAEPAAAVAAVEPTDTRLDAEPGNAAGGSELARAAVAGPVTSEPVWAIDARDLVKSYRGRRRGDPPVPAVRGVSLRVAAGTIFGLIGPNGAGKSTTIRMLATLARPDGGTATVAGHDLLRRPWDVRRAIAIVPQRSGADPDATGRENLLLQGRLYGLGGAVLARRADDLLDRFALTDAADRLARTYSGGMLRRLDVAIGLVARPDVLFLDEPTTGLDPESRAVMWAEIEALTADGLSILLTTHYLEEADRLAARVAIIENGAVVIEGTPDELKSELHGDAIDLELAKVPDAAQAGALRGRLAALPGAGEVTLDGRAVRARMSGGAGALPAVLAAVAGAGLAATSASVARPSLDDVYLRHVGRRFGPREEVA
jgi:ABC-2 type transport system ATP-binding protein